MLRLFVEIIKFPFKLIGSLLGGILWLLGSLLVHGENKDAKKIAVGLLLLLSFGVAATYYSLNQSSIRTLGNAIVIFLVLFLLISCNVYLFRRAEKNDK